MLIYAILVILPTLTLSADPPDQLAKDLFNAIDADKDGRIVQNEAEKFFLSFDKNNDADVSLAEFTSSIDNLLPLFKGFELVLFNLFDLERNQHVDRSDIDLVFKAADDDGDGIVSDAEFNTVFAVIINSFG